MSAAINLGRPAHLSKLLAMVAAFHEEVGITKSAELRRASVAPLLDGIPHGTVYLIGPPRAPIGYMLLTFGWSLELGGIDGTIHELYTRPGVRQRGVGTEALQKIPKALGEAGLMALHLKLVPADAKPRHLYSRTGFIPSKNNTFMTRKL